MTYRWLLFDADGTLFDYEAAEHQALTATLADYGLDAGSEVLATYQEVNARLWRDFEQGLTTPDRIKTERFARLCTRAFWKNDQRPALLQRTGALVDQAIGIGVADVTGGTDHSTEKRI